MRSNRLVTLDVSELEPPQPMHHITAALHKLQSGEVLVVKHRRKPTPLFDMLTGQYEYHCQKLSEDHYQLFFWRFEDAGAQQQSAVLLQENYRL